MSGSLAETRWTPWQYAGFRAATAATAHPVSRGMRNSLGPSAKTSKPHPRLGRRSSTRRRPYLKLHYALPCQHGTQGQVLPRRATLLVSLYQTSLSALRSYSFRYGEKDPICRCTLHALSASMRHVALTTPNSGAALVEASSENHVSVGPKVVGRMISPPGRERKRILERSILVI